MIIGWGGRDRSGIPDGIPDLSGKESGEENEGTWLTTCEPERDELVKDEPVSEEVVRAELEGTLAGGKEQEETVDGEEP